MTKSFLSIGECMVELADAGGGLYRRGFAGDTFNTAWYARRILPDDWQVSYGSCIGTDAASAEMAQFMAEQGIDTSSLRQVNDRSVGLYMISLDNGERSFSYWRSHSAARLLADDRGWLDKLFADRKVIYFSGITLAILSPQGRETLCAALAKARAMGATIAFDTNLRPRLWEDRETMQKGMLAGASVADIVLPSFDEEEVLFGDGSPDETVARYTTCGASIIAVKDGGGDLVLSVNGTVTRIAAQKVEQVVDSTAAGDSFGAAFVAGVASGQSPAEAATAAIELASKVIQSRGALVPAIFEGG